MLTLEHHRAVSGFHVLFWGQALDREQLASSAGLQGMLTVETTSPVSVSAPPALCWHLEMSTN